MSRTVDLTPLIRGLMGVVIEFVKHETGAGPDDEPDPDEVAELLRVAVVPLLVVAAHAARAVDLPKDSWMQSAAVAFDEGHEIVHGVACGGPGASVTTTLDAPRRAKGPVN